MIGLKEFKRTVGGFGIDDWERWFREGAAEGCQKDNSDWVLAFKPLLLDEQSDWADQVLTAVNELPEAVYHRACLAVGKAILNIPTRASPEYVEFFYRLAGTLRPNGLDASMRDLLRRPIVTDEIEIWTGALRTGAISSCSYVYSEALDDLFAELRETPAWWIGLIRNYLLAKLRVRPSDWFVLVEQHKIELQDLKENEPIEFNIFLRDFAASVGPRRLEKHLPELIRSNMRWFMNELFGPGKPANFDRSFGVRVGAKSAPLNFSSRHIPDDDLADLATYVLRQSPVARSAEQTKEVLLSKLAVEMAI